MQRYPVLWQGHLNLKNDSASVQMHFVAGNEHMAKDALTPDIIRILQRMKLEPVQIDGVAKRMEVSQNNIVIGCDNFTSTWPVIE